MKKKHKSSFPSFPGLAGCSVAYVGVEAVVSEQRHEIDDLFNVFLVVGFVGHEHFPCNEQCAENVSKTSENAGPEIHITKKACYTTL